MRRPTSHIRDEVQDCVRAPTRLAPASRASITHPALFNCIPQRVIKPLGRISNRLALFAPAPLGKAARAKIAARAQVVDAERISAPDFGAVCCPGARTHHRSHFAVTAPAQVRKAICACVLERVRPPPCGASALLAGSATAPGLCVGVREEDKKHNSETEHCGSGARGGGVPWNAVDVCVRDVICTGLATTDDTTNLDAVKVTLRKSSDVCRFLAEMTLARKIFKRQAIYGVELRSSYSFLFSQKESNSQEES